MLVLKISLIALVLGAFFNMLERNCIRVWNVEWAEHWALAAFVCAVVATAGGIATIVSL